MSFSILSVPLARQESGRLPSGVRVKAQIGNDWAGGFEVFAAQPSGGYLLRNIADRSILHVTFAASEVRLDPIPLPAAAPWSSPPAA